MKSSEIFDPQLTAIGKFSYSVRADRRRRSGSTGREVARTSGVRVALHSSFSDLRSRVNTASYRLADWPLVRAQCAATAELIDSVGRAAVPSVCTEQRRRFSRFSIPRAVCRVFGARRLGALAAVYRRLSISSIRTKTQPVLHVCAQWCGMPKRRGAFWRNALIAPRPCGWRG